MKKTCLDCTYCKRRIYAPLHVDVVCSKLYWRRHDDHAKRFILSRDDMTREGIIKPKIHRDEWEQAQSCEDYDGEEDKNVKSKVSKVSGVDGVYSGIPV